MKHHPEQQDDEIYMGNTTMDAVRELLWRTKRLGKTAFDRDGIPVQQESIDPIIDSKSLLIPCFIKVAEVERSIEAKLAAGDRDTANILQGMVDQRSIGLS